MVRQHAELQTAYDSKCTQFNALLGDYSQAKQQIDNVEVRLKKLRYENEKLFEEH